MTTEQALRKAIDAGFDPSDHYLDWKQRQVTYSLFYDLTFWSFLARALGRSDFHQVFVDFLNRGTTPKSVGPFFASLS
jgi:hypothetical protein